LFPDLTVDENLTVGGYAHARARDRVNRERVFHVFPRLAERTTQLASCSPAASSRCSPSVVP